MTHEYEKFDVAKLERLNDPARFDHLPPARIWQAFGLDHPRVIVEIGAGTGLFAAAFAALDPGVTVYVADIEPVMVDWMAANRPEVASGRLVPLLAEESRVPLDDGIADGVYMINLHHELADPAASYAEASRLIAPGGRILVVDWADRDTVGGPPLRVRASAASIGELLSAAGFDDIEIQPVLERHSVVAGVKRGAAR